MLLLAKSTGSFLGDLAAFAILGAVLFVIGIIWQIITGGGRKDGSDRGK